MKTKKTAPKLNAGSMADIAFLLLIFFLVTTTIASDKGIQRKLPKLCEGKDCIIDVHERNILRISLNGNQEIMVEDEIIAIGNLKDIVKAFVDNNGDDSCTYCNGFKVTTSSDNPSKAIISLQSHSQASYELFVKIQDELTKAYYELRQTYAKAILGKSIDNLNKDDKVLLKKAYPFIISEAQTK
ncbi:biopolymer transporter ExbD [Pontimicrobium sp. SW4]|uniref:Biopolymer transporter ExbD n=1 Tax=Pontimicrobium sp. SW4 TaxID=3153519 RepID=A0AAU7BWH8_9FLAO